MKKKLIAFLVTLTVGASLVGCGSSSEAETKDTSAQSEDSVKEDNTNTEADTTEAEDTSDGDATEAADASDGAEDELKAASEAEVDGELQMYVGDHATDIMLWKVAVAKGFIDEEFDEDNISLEVETFSGGPAVMEAAAAGEIQFGVVGTDPVINYASNGTPVEIVAGISEGYHAIQIVKRKESNIEKLEDLAGKKVAVTIGSFRHNLLLTALESVGLSADDIELLNLGNADIITALQAGEADAAVLTASNFAQVQDIADVLVYADEFKTNYNVLFATKDFASQYPNTTARVIRLADRATKWIAENREEAIQIFADATGLDEAAAELTYDTMIYEINFPVEKYEKEIGDSIEFDLKNEVIENEISVDDILDDTYFKLAGLAQ